MLRKKVPAKTNRVVGTIVLLVAIAATCAFPLRKANAIDYGFIRSDSNVYPAQAPSGRTGPDMGGPNPPSGNVRGTDYSTYTIPPAPATNRSYYIKTLTAGTAYNNGFSRGQADAYLTNTRDDGMVINSSVILAFGKPHIARDGANFNCPGDFAVLLITLTAACRPDIKTYAQNFIFGYVNGIGQGRSSVNLIMGVNNTDDKGNNSTVETYPHEAAGRDWGNLISEMRDYIIGNGFENHAFISGGDDIETGPSVPPDVGFEPPNLTKLWLKGYGETAGTLLFDFGDSGGCPGNDHTGTGLCAGLWHQSDVREVSMTGSSAPLPEIYARPPGDGRNMDMLISQQASEWEQIALYDYDQQMHDTGSYYSPIFLASLTQYAQCQYLLQHGSACPTKTDNPPADGWTYLYKALNDVDLVFVPNDRMKVERMYQYPPYALDIANDDVP